MIIGNCNEKCNCVTRKHYILSVVVTTMMNLRPHVRVTKIKLTCVSKTIKTWCEQYNFLAVQ